MKKFLAIAFVSLLALLPVSAQYAAGPARQSILTVTNVFRVPAFTTTNIPASLAPVFQGGRDGVGISVLAAGTNSATSTNCILTIKPYVSGVVSGPTSYTVNFTVGGTAGTPYYTNIGPTTVNLLDVPGLQLTSIQNTNGDTLFFTNITSYSR